MTVEVYKESAGMNYCPAEACCVCRAPTRYWYGSGVLNVALCQGCAIRADPETIPNKLEWIEAETMANKRPSFAAPW